MVIFIENHPRAGRASEDGMDEERRVSWTTPFGWMAEGGAGRTARPKIFSASFARKLLISHDLRKFFATF